MTDLRKLQKKILANKRAQGFNTKDIFLEFCFMQGEMSEAFQAYLHQRPDLGEELADIAIFLLGIAEIVGVNLGKEIDAKVRKNAKRKYRHINGAPVRIKG